MINYCENDLSIKQQWHPDIAPQNDTVGHPILGSSP